MAEFYWYKAKNEYYKLESDTAGKGFRYMPDPKQARMEYFGFEERTAKFLKDGQEAGVVVMITKDEFLKAAKNFWERVAKSLEALDKLIAH